MAGAAGEYGLALLPRPRTGRGAGAGGVRPGVAGPERLATRGKLFNLAVCVGGECIPIGVEAVPHDKLAAGRDRRAFCTRGATPRVGCEVKLRNSPARSAGAAC